MATATDAALRVLDNSVEQNDAALLGASLLRMGVIAASEAPRIEPLTGGVSSDIWKVQSGTRVLAIKRARPQLKVAQEWRAPIERNAYEVKWFRTVATIVPEAVPEILGEDREAGLFAMEYLDPALHPVWKGELRDGRVDLAFAAEVGRRLARIHAATARDPATAIEFATDKTFHAIRLEAYLETTARSHPSVERELMGLSRATLGTKRCLVHGDVSPKNILVGPNGPVFLDAECAWHGDPAFDLAFCLKHLMLKCLWTPRAAATFLDAFSALAQSYLAGVDWEPRDELEARIAKLLPALFLARADGKSPVEYIDEAGKTRVRRVALPLIAQPVARIGEVLARWREEVA
jgi:aminoglycoside phosphotransferase (APT) family kinase protein